MMITMILIIKHLFTTFTSNGTMKIINNFDQRIKPRLFR